MQDVYKKFDEVDNVIIASPLYFSELTGELLSFASRLQTVYAQQYLRGNIDFKYKDKYGALILVGGGDGSTKPAEDRADTIFKLMNVRKVDTVYSLDTNDIPSSEDENALRASRELGEKLNSLR